MVERPWQTDRISDSKIRSQKFIVEATPPFPLKFTPLNCWSLITSMQDKGIKDRLQMEIFHFFLCDFDN